MNSLTQQLKDFRMAKKLSARAFAKIYGLSIDNLYKWEKGTNPTKYEDIKKIENILNNNIEIESNLKTFTTSKEKYIAQGYSPTMPGFNESQKATAITTDLGLSSAVLLLVSELVAKMTGEPLEEVVKRANQLAKEGAKKSESALRHDVVIDSLVS